MARSTERDTQDRIIQLFTTELGYHYLGNWQNRENNSNIEEGLLTVYLQKKGYDAAQITKAIYALKTEANNFNDSLYTTNRNVYALLRYGVDIKTAVDKNTEKVQFVDWKNPAENDFAIAEEVSIKGNNTKRPDIVIYINGIALSVLELKKGSVAIGEATRQSNVNQQEDFIGSFFATVQYIFSANDTEGLVYGTIGTEEKWYLKWKEDIADNSRLLSDKYLLKMCIKDRFLEIIYDFIVFDGGKKKLPRVHQYFAVKAAQQYINRYEGGIIWHTQGSGKSITMVYLAKWVLENKPQARVVLLTDRNELDKQIEGVFKDAGETIYRTKSGKDLMLQLGQPSPRLLCSLVHKFGKKDASNFNQFIKELENQPSQTVGELFVFVDECHRTQSGRLHRTMKATLPNAVFVGFTGTPLLKVDKQTSREVFGNYIHTYKFNEGVADGVILDLVYEARDIDQRLSSPKKVDEWFKTKTKGLNDFLQSELKKKWGTMRKVLSSRSRKEKIVQDIIFDFSTKPRLSREKGNAILVAYSIYEACQYYKLFKNTNSALRDKVAIITSYNPHKSDLTTEDTGAGTDTEKEFMYNLYKELLGSKTTEKYEDWAKAKFQEEPANMKLLIVVSKLLTGYDAPTCSYLYIDKSMKDHGLFQAICRVNRLDSTDKEYGYIVDYKDLFKNLVNKDGTGALQVYTSELDYGDLEQTDIDVMLQSRLKIGKENLDNALEEMHILCEPVPVPKNTLAYIHYFCGNTEIPEELKARAVQRTALYKKTVTLARAYTNIKDAMDEAGYTEGEINRIKKEVEDYIQLREEIQHASGEILDRKSYEADMRHLIDTYIQAEESETISPFADMPLLEVIEKSGLADAIKNLPGSIKNNPEAVAETIENNVRKKIIKEHLINPAFFEDMSKLLEEIIRERKTQALSYEAYLREIAALVKKVNEGKSESTPATLQTRGQRALYDNLGKDGKLALLIDATVKKVRLDGWRGNLAKERVIKAEIYKQLSSYTREGNVIEEALSPYELKNEVESTFKIIVAQTEY